MKRTIYAIEISGVCNLGCSYCPYRLKQRARGLMSQKTIYRIMDLIKNGHMLANKPLHLHLFGEPMIHSGFEQIAKEIKAICKDVSFSTNGTKISKRRAASIAKVGFESVTISPHKPVAAEWAYNALKKYGVNVVMHGGPDHNWAGQVDNPVLWGTGCEFAYYNKVVVHWDGDVAVCCISDSKEGVIGTVWDSDIADREHKAISLCSSCHLTRPERREEDHGNEEETRKTANTEDNATNREAMSF
jgi:hypothetical protein